MDSKRSDMNLALVFGEAGFSAKVFNSFHIPNNVNYKHIVEAMRVRIPKMSQSLLPNNTVWERRLRRIRGQTKETVMP